MGWESARTLLSLNCSSELFQPFYVLSNMPYRVKVGETLAVEMVVFSYLSREISAEVTLENPNGSGFDFGSPNPNDIEDPNSPLVELHRTKRITIRPGSRTPVSFIITPQEIGTLEMKITAKSSFGQDVLVEKLRVEAEGETTYKSDSYFVDLTNKGELELNITVDIPRYAVPKSSRVFVAAVPDPVGPAINNLLLPQGLWGAEFGQSSPCTYPAGLSQGGGTVRTWDRGASQKGHGAWISKTVGL